MNYADFILEGNNYDPERVVSLYKDESYSLADYREKVSEVISFFKSNGFEKDSSAIIISDDSPSCIAVFLACIKYGIVPVLITPFTLDSVLEKGIQASDATYLFVSKDPKESDESYRPKFRDRVITITFSNSKKADAISLKILNSNLEISRRYVDSHESAYFLMTSGSSGIPKIVMHAHPAFPDTNKNYAVDTLRMNENDSIYSIAKMYFGYGLANNMFYPMLNGCCAYLYDGIFSPENLFASLQKFKPTVFFGIPSGYRMILDYLDKNPEKTSMLDCIRIYISSGEPLSADLNSSWKETTGKYISNNMGSSEASAILFDAGHDETLGSAGWPVKGTKVRLEGPDGKDSDIGVLYFTSGGNFVGYRNNPEANALAVHDGWFRTGDIFRRDKNGCYWGLGREDNMLKYHGMWVSPAEIEKEILSFDGVKQALVYKMTIDGHDMLAASVVTAHDSKTSDAERPDDMISDAVHSDDMISDAERPDDMISDAVHSDSSYFASELKEYLKSKIELYKCPEIIDVLDAFPLNNNGKKDMPVLKARIEALAKAR